MSTQIPTPARPYSERPWPRHTPAFTLLVCFLAFIGGALVFAWEYKTRWTPLERYYFQDYFRTAHLAKPQNPYLRPARTWEVLVIRYSRVERLAMDREVEPVALATAEGRKTTAFRLSPCGLNRCDWTIAGFTAGFASGFTGVLCGNSFALPGTPLS